MIGRLSGKAVDTRGAALLVDVGGVGYVVKVTETLLTRVSKQLASYAVSLELHTHQHVREDSHALYGFESIMELQAFEDLLRVKGVGPNAAIKILSHSTYANLLQLARAGDVAALTKIPGVGAKMAEAFIERL